MSDAEALRDKAEQIPKKNVEEDFSGEIQMIMYAVADLLEEVRQSDTE